MSAAHHSVTGAGRLLQMLPVWAHPGAYGSVVSVETTEQEVVLTYDDGPSPDTRAVLDVLAESGASATFFVSNQRSCVQPGGQGRVLTST